MEYRDSVLKELTASEAELLEENRVLRSQLAIEREIRNETLGHLQATSRQLSLARYKLQRMRHNQAR